MNIPKIIHSIWLGNSEKPAIVLKCFSTWKKFHPEYDFFHWNLENTSHIKNRFFREAVLAEKWAFASDYLRLYVLSTYGGLYLDSDLEVFQCLDEFLENEFFLGFEVYKGKALPMTAIIGAKKGNKIIGHIMSHYNKSFVVGKGYDMTPNTKIFAEELKLFGLNHPFNPRLHLTLKPKNSRIYPAYYFCTPEKDEPSYAMHHFQGSWIDGHKLILQISLLIFTLFIAKNNSWEKNKYRPPKKNKTICFRIKKYNFVISFD